MASSTTTTLICLQWVLQYVVCRDVTLPSGPLYRVAGFPLSLPCVVSGFEGSRTQDFEWFLYREDAEGRPMGVISTRDQSFPYTPFLPRVRSGEVRLERDAGDRVRLVVQRLRLEDQGRYECYTPSTDSSFQGNYSASVVVKVIPDTLQISHSRSLIGQPLAEGSELQLSCSAAVQSQQHTHLSVTFGMQGAGPAVGGASPREVISIGRELAVAPGVGGDYRRRYGDGELTLEKQPGQAAGDRDLYLMKMAAVAPGDAGAYHCEASQWILDPEGVWKRIAQRTLDLGNLTVRPLADSLTVAVVPRGEVWLSAGSPLSLLCEVGGVGAWSRSALLVQWVRQGGAGPGGAEVEVARLSPDGTVTWGGGAQRGAGGALEKVGEGRYALRLVSAYPADAGVYQCAVSVYAGKPRPQPSTPPTLTKRSEGLTVRLKTKEVSVTAVAEVARGPQLKRGSTVSLLCNVSVTTVGPSQVEVLWLKEREAPKGAGLWAEEGAERQEEGGASRPLALLTYDGLSRSYGNSSEVSVDRLATGCYRLRIHQAQPEDQGQYVCLAEVWAPDPHGAWYNTGARGESASVRVYLYSRATDLLLIPLVVGVSSALLVGVFIVAVVTCCFMNRLARQRSQK